MIRFTLKYLKPVALFLSVIVLFQCCVIYDKKPVNIDEAVAETKKIKIITNNGETISFENIYYKSDGNLYGLSSKNMIDTLEIKIPKTQIKEFRVITNQNRAKEKIETSNGTKYTFNFHYDKNDTIFANRIIRQQKEILIPLTSITKIRIHNPAKSTAGTVFLAIGSLLTGIIILVIISCDGDCNDGWFSEGM